MVVDLAGWVPKPQRENNRGLFSSFKEKAKMHLMEKALPPFTKWLRQSKYCMTHLMNTGIASGMDLSFKEISEGGMYL